MVNKRPSKFLMRKNIIAPSLRFRRPFRSALGTFNIDLDPRVAMLKGCLISRAKANTGLEGKRLHVSQSCGPRGSRAQPPLTSNCGQFMDMPGPWLALNHLRSSTASAALMLCSRSR